MIKILINKINISFLYSLEIFFLKSYSLSTRCKITKKNDKLKSKGKRMSF